jgi:hypothetical protein
LVLDQEVNAVGRVKVIQLLVVDLEGTMMRIGEPEAAVEEEEEGQRGGEQG